MSVPILEWTDKAPTELGWYFVREKLDPPRDPWEWQKESWSIKMTYRCRKDGPLLVTLNRAMPVEEARNVEWLGPINPNMLTNPPCSNCGYEFCECGEEE